MSTISSSSRLAPARRESAVSPTAPRPMGTGCSDIPTGAGFIHDTCPECGWDGDAAIIRDMEEGLVGWDCPECGYFVTMRDLAEVTW